MHELPLLIFTLLVQGSVGMTLFITLSAREKRALLPAMLIAFAIGALGLVASTLHLGYPLNAFHALRHVESSWLSREIVFASLYLAILGLATLLVLLKKQPSRILLALATLVGLIDIYCMGAIYFHSSVVTWQHFNTWVMFFGTAGILGGIFCNGLMAGATKLLRTAAVLIVVITAIRLLVQPSYINFLATMSLRDVVTLPYQPQAVFHQQDGLRNVAWSLSALGALLFTMGTWHSRRAAILLGGAALIVAEALLRFMFFSIH